MLRIFAPLLLLIAGLLSSHQTFAQQQNILCNTTTGANCNTTSNPGNGLQGDPAWLAFGKTNANFSQLFNVVGTSGFLPAPQYGIEYNNNGVLGGLAPSSIGVWCFSWSSLSAPPTLSPCGTGTGTVTSVGVTVPPWLTASGSPVTGNGTISITSSIVPNNNVLAGAISGSPTGLSPRPLVSGDIAAALATSSSINGTTIPASQTLLYASGPLGTPASGSAANLTNFPTLNQSTTGNAATASALATTPTQCPSLQFATGVGANGNANCATPVGSGNVSTAGTPSQYQIPAWASGTSIQGIGPGTSGQALISGGPAAYPSYSSSLSGVTSVNGSPIPASQTLLYSGGPGGTPSALTLTNATGLPNASVLGLGTFATQNAATPPAIGATTPNTGKFSAVTDTGIIGLTQCVHVDSTGLLSGTGADCGAPGVISFTGDGSLLNNSSSAGAVAATLANTGVGYGVWGGIAATSGAPGYHALSSYPTAAFPTLNQSTTGNAATATALATTPSQCTGGQFATGVTAAGGANCSTPTGAIAITGTPTQYQIPAWTSGSAVQGIGPGTAGQALVSNGSSAYPSYSSTLAGVASVNGSSVPASTTLAGLGTAETFTALQTFGTNISIGGVTALGANGTGKIVFDTSPTLTTPNVGAATGTSLSVSGQLTSTATTGTAPLVVSSTTNVPNLNASSLNGATFAAPGSIGSGTASSGAFTTLSTSGGLTNTKAGAASTSAQLLSGAPYAAGTGTTNYPLEYLNAGTAPTTWSASGTEFGINAPNAFSGNFLDFHVNGGASVASLSATGAMTASSFTGAGTGLTALPAANLTGTASVNTTGNAATASALGGSPGTNQFWGYNGTAQGWYTPTGSGTVNSGTAGQLAYYSATGTAVSGATIGAGLTLSGGTLSASGGGSTTMQTNGTNNLSQTTLNLISGSGMTFTNGSGGNVTGSAAYSIRVFAGTSDTITTADCANGVRYMSASPVTVTIPQATGSFAGCGFDMYMAGAGGVTAVPTTSTLNGSASLQFHPGTNALITATAGNYQASGPAVSNIWINACAFASNPAQCGSTVKEQSVVTCTAGSKTFHISESLPASYVGAKFAVSGCGPSEAQGILGGYAPVAGGSGYLAKSPAVNPASYTLSAITQANPMVATLSTAGSVNPFSGIAAATFTAVGMTQVNGVTLPVTAIGGSSGAWTVTFGLTDSSSFSAFTSGTLTPALYTGDILTVSGGTCTVQPQVEVLNVNGSGAIQQAAVVTGGSCTTPPGVGASTTGGTGTGATFTLSYQGSMISDTIASVGTNSVTTTSTAAATTVSSGQNWWEAGWDDAPWINAAIAAGASHVYLPVEVVAPWSSTAFPQYGIASQLNFPTGNTFRFDCGGQYVDALAPMAAQVSAINNGAFSTSAPSSGNGYNNCRWDAFGLAQINDLIGVGALKSNNNVYMNATVAPIYVYNIAGTVQRTQYTGGSIHQDPLLVPVAPAFGVWVTASNTDNEWTTFITDGQLYSAARADSADNTFTDWHSFGVYDGPTFDAEATKTSYIRATIDRPAPGQPAFYLNSTLAQVNGFNGGWITSGQWVNQYGIWISNPNGSNSIGCGNFGLVANWLTPQNEIVIAGAAGGTGANKNNTIAWDCIAGAGGIPMQFTGGTYGSSPAYGLGINSMHSNPPPFIDGFTAASATVPARYEFDFPSPVVGSANTGITYTTDYLLHLRTPTCTGGANTPTCGTTGSLLADGLIAANGGLSVTGTVSGSGLSTYLASPPAIGSTAASSGAFTTLSASGAVSGAGFSTYLASPPAIGGTTAGSGKFTTLNASGLITPTSNIGIKGTVAGDAAQAGSIGEVFLTNCPVNNTSASVTFSVASPTVVTWSSAPWSSSGPTNWTCAVNFTGTLPTGISASTTYYIAGASYNAGAGTFNLASTVALAIANTPDINVTAAGTPPYTGIMGAYSNGATGVVAGGAQQLTAGDWDCSGQVEFNVTTTATTTTFYQGGLINGSTFGSDIGSSTTIHVVSGSITNGTNSSIPTPPYNDDTNGNQTVQLLANWNSGAGVINMGGRERCRRMR